MPPTCCVGYRPLKFLRSWGQGCRSDPPGAGRETDGTWAAEWSDLRVGRNPLREGAACAVSHPWPTGGHRHLGRGLFSPWCCLNPTESDTGWMTWRTPYVTRRGCGGGTAPPAGVRSRLVQSIGAQLVERRLTMVEMHVDAGPRPGQHNELVNDLVDSGEASPAVSTAHSPRAPPPADGPRRWGLALIERPRDCAPRRGTSTSCPSRRSGFVLCISGFLVRSTSHLVEWHYSFRTAASEPCWRCSSCRKETSYRSTGSLRGYGERIRPSPPRGRSIPAFPLCGVSCENSVTTM